MKYSQHRMAPEHLGSGETHDFLYCYPFFPDNSSAPDIYYRAAFPVGTDASLTVFRHSKAGHIIGFMFGPTINVDHQRNRFFLPLNSGKTCQFLDRGLSVDHYKKISTHQ
jgi:hypothetical protein